MQQATKTTNCAAYHAISATLRDGFELAPKAEGKAPKTLRIYLQAVDALLAFTAERGMPDFGELTAEHLREFVASLYARGNKASTVSNRYRALRRFFAWLRDEGERTDNPLERIAAPRIPDQVMPHYEAGEVDALTRISPPGASRVFEPSRVVHAAAPDAPGPASSTRVAIDVAPTVGRPAALAFDLPRREESAVVSEPERAHGPVTVPVSARHRRWAPPAEADPRRADVGVTRYTVEAAVRFIYEARGLSVGGWRYRPGQAGDTSVMGWQIMALTSARRAGIDVPDDAFDIAAKWLDLVHRPSQPGTYTYQPRREVTPAMTAEGMFVRQLLGAGRDEPRMRGSAKYILDHPPGWRPDANTYYWYYATLALFQHQGSEWRQWNESIKLLLVGRQLTSGRMAGSCDPDGRWAGVAGRVYQTAIATLTLEVYYRYLPSFVRQP